MYWVDPRSHPIVIRCFVLLMLAWGFLPLAHAQNTAPLPAPELWSEPDGLHIRWQGSLPTATATAGATNGWTTWNGVEGQAPVYWITVHLPTGAAPTVRLLRQQSTRWSGRMRPSVQAEPPVMTGDDLSEMPDSALGGDAVAGQQKLPGAPVTVVRQGKLRGQLLAVLAVTPVWQAQGVLQATSLVEAVVPGAVLQADASLSNPRNGPFLTEGVTPPNPLAQQAVVRVRVQQGGMQRLRGTDLHVVGLDPRTVDVSRLHLRGRTGELALADRRANAQQFSLSDELWFYLPEVGDRWNSHTELWLTLEATPGRRMATRQVATTSAPVRGVANAQGVYHEQRVYDSRHAGPDGDHWFGATLRTLPGQVAAPFAVPMPPPMPLVDGPTQLVISGSAHVGDQHQLRLGLGRSSQTISWNGTGVFTHTLSLAGSGDQVLLELLPGATPSGILLDSVAWERPVQLDAQNRAITFAGVAGDWQYRLMRPPTGAVVYDLNNSQAPVLLQGVAVTADGLVWTDGPVAHRYLVVGSSQPAVPQLNAYPAADLQSPQQADVVYIAPRALLATLQPLLTHRRGQGRAVAVVAVEDVYTGWSWGMVDPGAIRAFLRWTAAKWSRPPQAVVLVGDGTSDPRDYLLTGAPTLIPPYLAEVDPWLGESACESCFVQLDGSDPLDGAGSDTLVDMAIGRLPVKDNGELAILVRKLIAYDTDREAGAWRQRVLYLADDADDAGDFAALADQSVAELPAGVQAERVYFDPNGGAPWREPDPLRARTRVLSALTDGALLASYTGHAQPFQWALTSLSADPNYLLSLYDPDDIVNGNRQPILLEMTCLTGAFHRPTPSGTTIDERWLLRGDGGAAAVWGPTGQGLSAGHALLQRGFHRALWAATSPPTLGALTTAGYLELWGQSICCQDLLHTFALLGDPLTPMGYVPSRQFIYLPQVRR